MKNVAATNLQASESYLLQPLHFPIYLLPQPYLTLIFSIAFNHSSNAPKVPKNNAQYTWCTIIPILPYARVVLSLVKNTMSPGSSPASHACRFRNLIVSASSKLTSYSSPRFHSGRNDHQLLPLTRLAKRKYTQILYRLKPRSRGQIFCPSNTDRRYCPSGRLGSGD